MSTIVLFLIVIAIVAVAVREIHRCRSQAREPRGNGNFELRENEGAVVEEAAVKQHENEGVEGNEIDESEDERNEEQGDENEEAEDQGVADEEEAVLVYGERNEGLPDNDRVNEIIANHLERACCS